MRNDIVKNEGGRPTKYSDELVIKLESILKIGGTIEEACSYALISKETYYRWLKEDEGFMTKMEQAKHYSDIVAKNIVVDSMHKDRNIDTAKWWLDKREFAKGPVNVNVQGEKVLVVPSELINKYDKQTPHDAGNSSE